MFLIWVKICITIALQTDIDILREIKTDSIRANNASALFASWQNIEEWLAAKRKQNKTSFISAIWPSKWEN